MNKDAPSKGRIFAMVAFTLSCFGLALFLWLAFGGAVPFKPKGYRFETSFGEATQLAKEADVRISGVPVGKVKEIEPDKKTGRSNAIIEIKAKYAPIPSDAKAILRQKTLLGETYVELTPGTPNAPKLKEGQMLPASQVSDTVELDEILRAFDQKTRDAFQSWLANQAVAVNGRGRDINNALGQLEPFTEDLHTLVSILNDQQGAVTQLVKNTGVVFGALGERDDQLASLITNSNTVFRTTAQRDRDLQDTFRILPTFNQESRQTLDRLASFSTNANPLINQLRPAAKQLSPTLTDLSALAPDLQSLFRDLDKLITASKTGLPAAQRILHDLPPLLGQLDPFLREVNPIVSFLTLYKQELSAFFSNTVAATEVTDTPPGAKAPVHYLRTTNPVNLEALAVYPQRLGTNRNNPYTMPGAFTKIGKNFPVYETRQCGRGVPVVSQLASTVVPSSLLDLVNSALKPVTAPVNGAIAINCNKQGDFTFQGKTSQYPQVAREPK